MAHVLTLPGVKGMFALGMSWRHEETVPKPKVLRELAADMGRWGTVYTASGGGVQVGFSHPIEGLKSPGKAVSLAAAVADEFTQPGRGIFKLAHDLYWYVAVRDGQEILNDGDVVGNADHVARVWQEHDRLQPWATELTDKPLDIIADAVSAKRKLARLRDLSYDPSKLYVGAGVIGLLGLIAAGVAGYVHHQREEALMQKQVAAARAAAAAAQAAADAKASILPWASLPLPHDVFGLCQSQWGQQALSVKGWAMQAWTCTASAAGISIETKWRRAGGVANDAPGNLDSSGETSTQLTFRAGTYSGLNRDALTGEAAPRAMYTLAQTYGVRLQLTPPPVMVPKETPDAPTASPPLPWLSYPVAMDLNAPPWLEIGTAPFDQVTGLRIASVRYDVDKRSWTTGGDLYAMREAVATDTAASDASGVVPTQVGASVAAPVSAASAVEASASPSTAASGQVISASAPVGVSSTVAADKAKPVDAPHVSVSRASAAAPIVASTATVVPVAARIAGQPGASSPVAAVATATSGVVSTNADPQAGMGALALVAAHHKANAPVPAVVATAPSQAARAIPSTIPPGVGK
jgi:hypothetical protein